MSNLSHPSFLQFVYPAHISTHVRLTVSLEVPLSQQRSSFHQTSDVFFSKGHDPITQGPQGQMPGTCETHLQGVLLLSLSLTLSLSFLVSVLLKLLSLFGRSTFAVWPHVNPPHLPSLPPLFLHRNQRNESGRSAAQHKDIERKQTQFMTDADEDRQRQ